MTYFALKRAGSWDEGEPTMKEKLQSTMENFPYSIMEVFIRLVAAPLKLGRFKEGGRIDNQRKALARGDAPYGSTYPEQTSTTGAKITRVELW